MKKWLWATILLSLLQFTVVTADAVQPFMFSPLLKPFGRDVPSVVDFNGKDAADIPLKMDVGLIIVEVKINDKGPFRFIVDTGTDVSILSSDLVEQLEIKPINVRKRTFHTHQKQIDINTFQYLIKKVQLGEIVFNNATFIATNTANDDFQLLKNLNVQGVLGQNTFYDIVMTLDLSENKMIMQRPDKVVHTEKGYISFESDYYLPIIKTKIIKKGSESTNLFLIDTGYSGFVKMAECYKNDETPMNNDVLSHDIFNRPENGFLAELDGVWLIGDIKIERPMVKYEMGTCEKSPKWGLIGTRFLQYHKVTIDQRHRYVIFH